MVRAKKNILSKCFCSVIVHGIYYFTTFVVKYMMLLMNGIVCLVSKRGV